MPIGASLGVGLAGVAGSAIAGKANAKAIKNSTAAQMQSSAQTTALARDIYGQNKAALTPFMGYGQSAGNALNDILGLGTSEGHNEAARDFRNYIANSDYGFQFGEGANALNSGYAGAGTLQSGAAMRDLEKYRQDLQAGYRGEFNNLLANQQAVGLGAGSALAGVGQNYVNTVSANNQNAANALSASAVARANNTNAMIGGIGNSLGQSIGFLNDRGYF